MMVAMHPIDPHEPSGDLGGKILNLVAKVVEAEPPRTGLDGDLERGTFYCWVPSERTYPGLAYRVRVDWHPDHVEAGHHGHACPAQELAGGHCRHVHAAAAAIAATYFDGRIPVPEVAPLRRATSPARPAASPARPAAGDSWWG